jgi:hypothetical protein
MLELMLITAPIWALLCAVIANSKHRSVGAWAIGGLLFGLFAVLILVMSADGDAYRFKAPRRPSYGPSRDPFKR